MKRGQNVSTAVMARRVEPADSLDFFPTPPWATRALCEHLNHWGDVSTESCCEPACGEGHMARPLAEYFASVFASDVHDYSGVYPGQARVLDFLIPWERPPLGKGYLNPAPDWIVTNPPFRLAAEFVLRGLEVAKVGVAVLVRTAFLESIDRYTRLFRDRPPEWILQFTERLPIFRGRLDPTGSSATAYCWIIWLQPAAPRPHQFPALVWIPPCRAALERPGDYPAAESAQPGPLFPEATP